MVFPVLVIALLAFTQFQAIRITLSHQKKEVPAQPPKSAPKGTAACTIELLNATDGVDFNPYLRDVYLSVKRRWFAVMPPSVGKGEQGYNTVEFRVSRDGNIAKDSVRMASSSRKADFDAASLEAIREAAPFSHLPEKFSNPYIEFRFSFFYNLSPPKRQ
jgi:TonB family protein